MGVHNAAKLFGELRKRGYSGCLTQLKKVVGPSRREGQERAFVRFETATGEQAQMDWGHFGNWGGKRLYSFALTLCWSRMRYVEFTQRHDAETLLKYMVHAFEFAQVTWTTLNGLRSAIWAPSVAGGRGLSSRTTAFAEFAPSLQFGVPFSYTIDGGITITLSTRRQVVFRSVCISDATGTHMILGAGYSIRFDRYSHR